MNLERQLRKAVKGRADAIRALEQMEIAARTLREQLEATRALDTGEAFSTSLRVVAAEWPSVHQAQERLVRWLDHMLDVGRRVAVAHNGRRGP